jgi:RNA 3'-terminal phosphate cyclase
MGVLSECVRTTVDMESRINQFLEAFESQPPLRSPATAHGANVSGQPGERRDSSVQGVLEQDAAGVHAAYSPRQQQPGQKVELLSYR